mmetsp:Transcript_61684/g.151823  ORF Transcript_61684/g.151823 Transcript_61684/m.151823 type:complete len:245 (-) Transcript_61684:943-1677(-)
MACIVKAVCHLVPTDGAQGPEVAGIGVVLVIERLLDNTSRHPQTVNGRAVEGVHYNRVRLPPPLPPRPLKDARPRPRNSINPHDINILSKRPPLDQRPIIPEHTFRPLVRVSHLEEHLVELLLGRALRLLVHPPRARDRDAELLADFIQHVGNGILALFRECVFDPQVARRPPQQARCRLIALLPSRLGCLGVVPLLVPFVQRVLEIWVQVACIVVQQLEAHVRSYPPPALVQRQLRAVERLAR